jgi:hypothetical protein
VLSKREENQWLVFERKVLRTIYGPKIENGVYSSRYNHELDKEFNKPNALKTEYPERPKFRWADRVNSDSLALGVRVWTHFAKGRHGQIFFNRP